MAMKLPPKAFSEIMEEAWEAKPPRDQRERKRWCWEMAQRIAEAHQMHPRSLYDRAMRWSGGRILPAELAAGEALLKHASRAAAPPGWLHDKATVQVAGDGTIERFWLKPRAADQERLQALEEALLQLLEPYRGAIKPVKSPAKTDRDLLNVIPIGDHHVGMYASPAETGDSAWSLDKAEDILARGVEELLARAPAAGTCMIAALGDFMHVDNEQGRTTAHGNPLDMAGRYCEVMDTAIRLMRRVIDSAVRRHGRVVVWSLPGNHDDIGALWLARVLAAAYEGEPRVQVETSPDRFLYHRHGRVLLGAHHGHGTKMSQLAGVMAASRPADWGATRWRHWYTGHIHQDRLIESPGATVEAVRILAPRDAYAHISGYRSDRDIKVDTWHAERGPRGRCVVTIDELEDNEHA